MPVDPARYRPAPTTPTLGDGFFAEVEPARFPLERLRYRAKRAAAEVGLDGLTDDEWRRAFARFEPLPDNLTRPLALAYHGHQFGQYNPALGDGRGFVYAQLRDGRGRLLDLGTKGSGTTPWSRDGDGRLTLKGGVREVLAAAMLEALGVETSRPFSLYETGETLHRHDEPSPTRSSVLVRLSHSHVRFGSFQRLAHQGDRARLATLVDFVVNHYHPDLADSDDRVFALYRRVAVVTAALVGQWMAAGFVHGVLNTDNISITGESFDYGPYRFLPTWDPRFVAAYFDHGGRYAFGRQLEAALWGLMRLGEALSPLVPFEQLRAALVDAEAQFLRAFHRAFLRRLGLRPRAPVEDSLLVSRATCFLGRSQLGVDRFFLDWWGGERSAPRATASPVAALYRGDAFDAFRRALAPYEAAAPERLDGPYFRREAPVTLLYDEIEALWAPIVRDDDWSRFDAKLADIDLLRREGLAC